MSIFTKKSKLMLYNENQKNEMIEKLESQNIEYKIREKKADLLSDGTYFEVIIAADDLSKIS